MQVPISLETINFIFRYTAKNATALVQVVDFNDLMQFANKLYQACCLYQVAVNIRFAAT